MPNQDDVELRWIFAVIRRWWWLILGCTLLAAVMAYGVIASRDSAYEATATLLVSPGQGSRTNDYNSLVAGERLALTYIEMLESPTILDAVKSRIGLQESTEDLAKRIQASTVKDTQLIRLKVRDTSPAQAALLANTIADVFTSKIQKLQLEQYTTSLVNLQDEMDALKTASEDTQAQVDALNASKIENEAKLVSLNNQLREQVDDYRSLEMGYQDLQLTLSQLTDVVKVVEPAQPPDKNAGAPYQVTTTLLIGNAPGSTSMEANQQLIETYSEMLVARSVLETVIAKRGLQEDLESLMAKISVDPVEGTQLIRLNVVDTDTAKAALIANTITEIFIDNVKGLLEAPYSGRLAAMEEQLAVLSAKAKDIQTETATLTTSNGQIAAELARQEALLSDQHSDYQDLKGDYDQLRLAAAEAAGVVSITEPARAPDKVADTNLALFTFIAAIAGALLALGLAILLEYLNDKLREPEDVSRLLGLAPLGTIGQIAKDEKGLVVISQPLSPSAEEFRMLATNLRYTSLEHPLRTLLVTSPNTQEGKSVVTANLAAALALTELRVLVVDADLRRPHQHQIFELDQGGGLTNALLEGTLNGRLRQADLAGLQVLTSGDPPPNPAEVLVSSRMQALLKELQQQADLVLIDCPPVLPVADATILAPHVDGVLIVVHANRTRSRAAIEAVESLRRVGAHIVGVVFNAAPSRKKSYYDYYSSPEMEKVQGKPKENLNGVLTNAPGGIGGEG
jgi:capsular exopolysaccharide synthesis family protein